MLDKGFTCQPLIKNTEPPIVGSTPKQEMLQNTQLSGHESLQFTKTTCGKNSFNKLKSLMLN